MVWETSNESRPTTVTLLTGLLFLQAALLIIYGVIGLSLSELDSSSLLFALTIMVGGSAYLSTTGYLLYRQKEVGFYMLVASLVLQGGSLGFDLIDAPSRLEVDFGLVLYLGMVVATILSAKWFFSGRWERT